MNNVTNDFQIFMEKSDGVGTAFMEFVKKMSQASVLDKKTHELAYIAVLSTQQMLRGIPFHVKQAKEYGASLDEVKSAILVGMPLVGLRVSEAFATAVLAYHAEHESNESSL